MDPDLSSVQTQIQGANTNSTVVLNGSVFNICTLATDNRKTEISNDKFGSESTSGLIDGNVFTVDSSKGKIFSAVADNFANVNVSEFGLSSVNHGVDIATSTVPTQLLQHDPATTSDGGFIQVFKTDDAAPHHTVSSKTLPSGTSSVETVAAPVVTAAPIGTILEIIQVSAAPNNGEAGTAIGTQILLQQNALNAPKRKGGWPKGKRRKEPKDSSIPKPPVTGYILYANEHRGRVKDANPNETFSGVTKLLGAEWSALEQAEKQKYLDQAEEDKKRYIEEFKAYQESEEYLSQVSKKKAKSGVLSVSEFGDTDICSMEDMDSEMLYCKVCDQYFSSMHNRKEHMFGKTHLAKVSSAIERITREDPETSLKSSPAAAGDGDSQLSLPSFENSEFAKQSEPMDLEGYLFQVIEKNSERELELRHLRRELEHQQSRHLELASTIREYEELHNKYIQDVGNAKAYGSALATQINTLRMVPTLFGVIHF